jgi:hypothetical protein
MLGIDLSKLKILILTAEAPISTSVLYRTEGQLEFQVAETRPLTIDLPLGGDPALRAGGGQVGPFSPAMRWSLKVEGLSGVYTTVLSQSASM